jgi:hypothetical protein
MTLCDVVVNTDISEDPASFIFRVVTMKATSTSENWIFVYKTTRRHIQEDSMCTVTPVRSPKSNFCIHTFPIPILISEVQCATDGHCGLFLDCYRINVFLLFNISYTLLVAFPHQRADSLEWSLHRLNLCSAAGETVICRIVGNMTSKYFPRSRLPSSSFAFLAVLLHLCFLSLLCMFFSFSLRNTIVDLAWLKFEELCWKFYLSWTNGNIN